MTIYLTCNELRYIFADMPSSSADTCQTSFPSPNQLPFEVALATFSKISEIILTLEKNENNIPKSHKNPKNFPKNSENQDYLFMKTQARSKN